MIEFHKNNNSGRWKWVVKSGNGVVFGQGEDDDIKEARLKALEISHKMTIALADGTLERRA